MASLSENWIFSNNNTYSFTTMMDREISEVDEYVYSTLQIENKSIYSFYLERDVIIDIHLPLKVDFLKDVPLLLINDGQDLRKIDFGSILDELVYSGKIEPIIAVGIHCGSDRMNEYGTVYRADYKGRGARAGLYNKFIFDELLPFIIKQYKITSFKETAFAGFSLGGLSALDCVWNHPSEFSKVGVFSGSLWWRRKSSDDIDYNWNTDRIMHLQVQNGRHYSGLKFFFECGRLDETADRNNNGIIDSIEDTTDLIADLKLKGYSDEQIHYFEMEDGEHNIETWARAIPVFLKWGWGR